MTPLRRFQTTRSVKRTKQGPYPEQQAIRNHVTSGLLISLGFGGALGLLAANTEISGAVMAPGQLAVESYVKKVQHQTGGIIGEIRVHDGSTVREGEVVARLDPTVLQSGLAIITHTLDELAMRQARLEAEHGGLPSLSLPYAIARRMNEADIARLVSAEYRLLTLRQSARNGQKLQHLERIDQINNEITGILAQVAAKADQIHWIEKELQGVHNLFDKQLVQYSRLTSLEREKARLQGEQGSLVSSIAQAKGRIGEIHLQIGQIDQDTRSDAAKELHEVQSKMVELTERKLMAQDQLDRVDIRAPRSGIVHQLMIHTIGGVVQAGEAMMLIVPDNDPLVVEAKVLPQDIDQIAIGQMVNLRFPALNQRTTPELNGQLSHISADLTADQRTGLTAYSVRIDIGTDEIDKMDGTRLVSGMPVEAFIQTRKRSIYSYLSKPITDQFTKSFRHR